MNNYNQFTSYCLCCIHSYKYYTPHFLFQRLCIIYWLRICLRVKQNCNCCVFQKYFFMSKTTIHIGCCCCCCCCCGGASFCPELNWLQTHLLLMMERIVYLNFGFPLFEKGLSLINIVDKNVCQVFFYFQNHFLVYGFGFNQLHH